MVQYKKFKLDSLFDIQKVRGINKSGLTQPSDSECYDYITRTSKDNGIESHTGLVESRELNEAGTFSLGLLQMTFFYRDKPWYAGQFVRKIVPKRLMTKEQLLYFLGVFQALRPLLSSVLVRKVDETFSNVKIELPVTSAGDPNFEYMTMWIRELEAERIRELEAYLRVTGLDDTTLSASEAQALTQKVQWKKFRIGDVFERVSLSRKIKHFKKSRDVSTVQSLDYNLPLVNSKVGNNGVMYYGKSSEWNSTNLAIDIIQDGAVGAGMVYAHPDSVGCLYNAYLIRWKDDSDNITPEVVLYFATMIRKAVRGNYNYQRKATWDRVQENDFLLPVTSNDQINFDYMQNYIRATEKQTIKDVVEYKDQVIEETKKVVNE